MRYLQWYREKVKRRIIIMNKIYMLAKANIKKSRSATVTLFLIIFIASILLSLGCMTLLNYKKSFDKKVEELNSAHVAAVIMEQAYKDKYDEYFTDNPKVTDTEKEKVIFLPSAKFNFRSGEIAFPLVFLNADYERKMSTLSLVGEHKETGDRDIYVSYLMYSGGGYKLGDDFTIIYGGRDYTFRIAGFTEDVLFGSTNMGYLGFHMPEKTYQWFQAQLNDPMTNGILLQAKLTDWMLSNDMKNDFKKNVLEGNKGSIFAANSFVISIQDAKSARTATADIGGSIISGFSLIIVLISLLVIRFRIVTSIEDGMTDIGALKALGYSSVQIIASFILQFTQIALVGSLSGIAFSYLAVKPLAVMFSAQTGIIWNQGFDPVSSGINIILILFLVFIVTLLAARRIKKLHPIIALRTGIATHSFKKNHCPLTMKGSLNFVMAMKSMVQNLKQNIMITCIIAAISFACVFGVVLYYNIVADNKAFINMLGVEMCSVSATVLPGEDAGTLVNEFQKMDGVRKAIKYDYSNVTINDTECQVYIAEDFAQLDNNLSYEGRYPQYENEAAVTGFVAEKFNKKVGETITIHLGGKSADYLITGLVESSNNMGMGVFLTYDGVKVMNPEYKFNNINIYLKKGSDVDSFNTQLADKYGSKLAGTVNMDKLADSQLGVYTSIVAIFAYFILLVTAFMVALILYLVIKALIIRRKKDFGIQKALGYTTLQLMVQTSLSFLPIVLIGVAIGSILGSIYINPLLALLFRGIGVMKVDFVIPLVWLGFLCAGLCILAYAVAMLVSRRIKKISAYGLIVE
jgi:putative ABC transport system permease protein